MTYNPEIHRRRSIRLQEYDYRSAGAYFVTVCMFQRETILGDVCGGEMRLTPFGEVVQACWNEISRHFPGVALDAFVVMPNHIHGILVFHESVGATHASPCSGITGQPGPAKRSLGSIVGSFKSACAKQINELRGVTGLPVWQRNYHERVIRDDDELEVFRAYIINNPAQWENDDEHPSVAVPVDKNTGVSLKGEACLAPTHDLTLHSR